MNIEDMLAPDGVVPRLKAEDKKQALQALATKAEATTGAPAREIYAALLQRERLSSTSLGRGIAIPHIKLPVIKAITCLFARLERPIPFESHDGEPVDLLFFLLAPEQAGGDHLKALARISRLVRDPATLEGLRNAKDVNELRLVLTKPLASNAA
ncbi:PTS IIA-like nitrogen-regulatory protein PtsN [Hyphomicrobium denitrificans 1NES1]|uniref:PTS IIA-like nitrogen-regulatory protein PtsN n=1 Tax=Hyphomicrobium denitrificans 1NES1 TaxID=670307 RepID=N0B0Z8_9HYPH|nr:PTS sugar transporter subunit IIA [Hyphomicrobium denitrificans]AGK56588.1 PTS IIA-like nitrogen-regulatory protein PtsN [Hyphomicrobium denitrificans 1NES1]